MRNKIFYSVNAFVKFCKYCNVEFEIAPSDTILPLNVFVCIPCSLKRQLEAQGLTVFSLDEINQIRSFLKTYFIYDSNGKMIGNAFGARPSSFTDEQWKSFLDKLQ